MSTRNLLTGCALFLIGCGELAVDEPALSEVSFEIGLGPHVSGSGPNPIPVGSTDMRTCYLRGISGVLHGGITSHGVLKAASVSVYPEDGMWWVRAHAFTGQLVAHVGCVYLPYAGIEFSWSGADPGESVNAPPNRHCFLREIRSVWGLDGSLGPRGERTNVSIREQDGQFTMAGSYMHEGDTGRWGVSQGAIATCFDFPATREWDFTVAGPEPQEVGNTYTSYVRPALVFTACGLTAVGGDWSAPASDGVVASTTNGAEWRVTAAKLKQAGIHCVH